MIFHWNLYSIFKELTNVSVRTVYMMRSSNNVYETINKATVTYGTDKWNKDKTRNLKPALCNIFLSVFLAYNNTEMLYIIVKKMTPNILQYNSARSKWVGFNMWWNVWKRTR